MSLRSTASAIASESKKNVLVRLYGEAHLLHRTVACERRERRRAGVVAVPMISSAGIDSFGISINSRN